MEASKSKIKLPKDIPVGTSKKESDVAWRLKGRKRALFTAQPLRETLFESCKKSVMITKAL